jgi:hypothetical protein
MSGMIDFGEVDRLKLGEDVIFDRTAYLTFY